jgi:hypothetical protein
MSADPVEDIADAMVTFLNGAASWDDEPSFKFTAEKSDSAIGKVYKEKQTTLKVLVVPWGEAAEKIDRGGKALESYLVQLVIVRQMDADFTRAKLAVFARELKIAIRHNRRLAGYPWSGDETVMKFDSIALAEMNNFATATQFNFAGIK